LKLNRLVIGILALVLFSGLGTPAFAGVTPHLPPACTHTWNGGEGDWEDNNWTPSRPTSGASEVICIDGGNSMNSIVHLNSDFDAPLDIIVDQGDKLVVEKNWTLLHGALNLSFHNNGILQIFGSYEQFGSIFFNDGEVIVECEGSFDILFGGVLEGNPITIVDCFVGGDFIGVDSTALLLAGSQMTAAWLIPIIVSAVGIGLVLVRRK